MVVQQDDLAPYLSHPALARLRARLRHLLTPATAAGDAVEVMGGGGGGAARGTDGPGPGPFAEAAGQGWDAAAGMAAVAARNAANGANDPWVARATELATQGTTLICLPLCVALMCYLVPRSTAW